MKRSQEPGARSKEWGIPGQEEGKCNMIILAPCSWLLTTYSFPPMKHLTIVVKPFKAEAVLKAVSEADVIACTVREAKGYSRQKGYLDRYLGSEYSMAFLPKVEISVWVSTPRYQEVIDRIVKAARTGRIGDGKILVSDACWPGALEF